VSLISVSVVTFHPNFDVLKQLFEALDRAVAQLRVQGCSPAGVSVKVADNSSDDVVLRKIATLLQTVAPNLDVELEGMLSNLGYGRAHNHCLLKSDSKYHLVLNPDVLMQDDTLLEAVRYLDEHPEIGLLTPRGFDEHGAQSYLAKRQPRVTDLLLRGFAPGFVRGWFRKRLVRYEMRDVIADEPLVGVPIASGCFMFFRTAVLQQVGGFDPRYFMYFEDFDLCMKLHGVAEIAYVPSVRITHFGGDAAKKGWLHIRMFSVSAFRFFNRWGWRWF
jgi:hypothetical protein